MKPTLLLLILVGACKQEGQRVERLEGSLSWTVDFRAAAEDMGYEDCSYTRSYSGHEDHSAPWLCPDCDVVFRVASTLKPGRACYQTIAEGDPEPEEWLGWGDGVFYRSSRPNYGLSDQGTVRIDEDGVRPSNETEWYSLDDGAEFRLLVEGDLGFVEGVGDPMWGYAPPESSSCGWEPVVSRPAYSGKWRLAEGKRLPDGWFLDVCSEGVRLHDRLGQYLVVEISATDCPPCQDMAETEHAFVADLAASGIDVEGITLLAPALSDVLGPTPAEDLDAWRRSFDLTDPVLADRGWGYWLGAEALGDDFGYPTTVVVAPGGKVLDLRSGFGGWDVLADVIRADAGAR